MREGFTTLLEQTRKILRIHTAEPKKISSETATSHTAMQSKKGTKELRESEPIAELRARTDGKNVALSFVIPTDTHTRFTLDLYDAQKDPVIARAVQTFFADLPQFLCSVARDELGTLSLFNFEGEFRSNRNASSESITSQTRLELSAEEEHTGRLVIHGTDGAVMSIRVRSTPEVSRTEREQYLLENTPQIRRIHNESWFNSKHVPSAYVDTDYTPELDGTPLQFLQEHEQAMGTDTWRWAPFCPDRDKYWGIAARAPQNSCEVLEDVAVTVAVSTEPGLQHRRQPLDIPRTYLTTEKVVYLKPDIQKGERRVGTEGQTGLIHLGEDPNDGWYYVTQPIPEIVEGKVAGYFVLIGRKATLIPEKEVVLYNAFWQKPVALQKISAALVGSE